jgi:hypothetical protein
MAKHLTMMIGKQHNNNAVLDEVLRALRKGRTGYGRAERTTGLRRPDGVSATAERGSETGREQLCV